MDLQHAPRVMVVDDNIDAADLLAQLLETFGFNALALYSGKTAISEALRFRPDFIFLDIGMPEMDGYEAIRRLRLLQGFAQLPIIALTAWNDVASRHRIAQAGFTHHTVKPAPLDDIFAILNAGSS